MNVTFKVRVNGVERSITTDPQRKLLEVLREELHLTGPKYGCGEGQCRACLVLLDEKPTMSCLLPVEAANGKSITTIEGLSQGDSLHTVQEAFLEEGAFQCGYCTGGMILAAVALLRRNPNPSDQEIKTGLNGNLCRCNGYHKVVKAIRSAAAKVRGKGHV